MTTGIEWKVEWAFYDSVRDLELRVSQITVPAKKGDYGKWIFFVTADAGHWLDNENIKSSYVDDEVFGTADEARKAAEAWYLNYIERN